MTTFGSVIWVWGETFCNTKQSSKTSNRWELWVVLDGYKDDVMQQSNKINKSYMSAEEESNKKPNVLRNFRHTRLNVVNFYFLAQQ